MRLFSRIAVVVVAAFSFTSAAMAQYSNPERGTQLRSSILDAARQVVAQEFGAPIEFVVESIRVADDRAYVELYAQRPGGGQIQVEWDGIGGSPTWVSGFMILNGDTWTPYDIVFGASEAWWVDDCSGLSRLMPETCPPDTNIVATNEPDAVVDTIEHARLSPLGEPILNVSAGFFDPNYPSAWNPPAQHLGTDLPAPDGTQVLSPVSGTVLLNRTDRADPFEKYLIVRSRASGHVRCP